MKKTKVGVEINVIDWGNVFNLIFLLSFAIFFLFLSITRSETPGKVVFGILTVMFAYFAGNFSSLQFKKKKIVYGTLVKDKK